MAKSTFFADAAPASSHIFTELSPASATAADFEQIALTGRPAGVYYARVTGAANPAYVLTVNVAITLTADWAEANDTQATAYDLRQVAGTIATGRSLSVSRIDPLFLAGLNSSVSQAIGSNSAMCTSPFA